MVYLSTKYSTWKKVVFLLNGKLTKLAFFSKSSFNGRFLKAYSMA